MHLRSRRHLLVGLVAALYTTALAVTVLTSLLSTLAVSVAFVAVVSWAYGFRAGAVTIAACLVVEYVIISSIVDARLRDSPRPIVMLIPALLTLTLVLISLTAFRNLELKQLATETALRQKNAELAAALDEVKELREMLPICAWCKRIRDMNGMWEQVEAYLSKHALATFTHGICPTCLARLEVEMRLEAKVKVR